MFENFIFDRISMCVAFPTTICGVKRITAESGITLVKQWQLIGVLSIMLRTHHDMFWVSDDLVS